MVDVELHLGDCLEIMPVLAGPFDAIICDLPFGSTACRWDTRIPFEPLWEQYKRLIKPRGAIVLFGSQPFTSALVMSNVKWFKYCWVWRKTKYQGWFNAHHCPLKAHEDIIVFSNGTTANCSENRMTYNPQGLTLVNKSWSRPRKYDAPWSKMTDRPSVKLDRVIEYEGYPISVIKFANPSNKLLHPTQKPAALLEYLIKTYTNEGETVLDNCFGSCTTGVACLNTGRNFVGIEKDEGYFQIAQSRIAAAQSEMVQASFETAP